MSVVQLRPFDAAPKIDSRTRFCSARRLMFAAFREWLAENPDPAQLEDEIDATAAIFRALRGLTMAATPESEGTANARRSGG